MGIAVEFFVNMQKSKGELKMKKKIFDAVSDFFAIGTNCYFWCSVFVTILSVVTASVKDYETPAVKSVLLLSCLLFSVLTALFVMLSKLIKNNSVIRNAVQFVLVYIGFVLSFLVGGAYLDNTSSNKLFTIVVMSGFFVVAYVVVVAINSVYKSILKRVVQGQEEYKDMFSDVKSK